ncbi:hypothetical protein MIND_01319600 [Mycena indigotica]|uniref:Uncharacterized protein n=1 Tax=Mycena indigotica TaxID=2126181 RepID=A0A8H6S2S3_9AGAR|nr:uncharacterized protein MIND_01319600 [Mycena indigotica]KAF7290787.1 hypothetical protein MIND_01319600 [Mycena indigotica]
MLFSALFLASSVAVSVHAGKPNYPAGVVATGTQGATNPPTATMPSIINQNSMSRLVSLNSIDDFCLFAPPQPNSLIADTEGEEVAWCTQPRNNARVIPDGVITGVSFLRTPFYVQLMGTGDFTKLNIRAGDAGGELDPHGATGAGNPVGGNVTTTVADGSDLQITEWMQYISSNQFCIRACTWANATFDAAHMCWHELDVMGCEFVMPGTYREPGTFETCDADIAYPPGWYPGVDASGKTTFSTFAQYFTGIYTGGDGQPTGYTVGDLTTPTTVAFVPQSSNCVTQATVKNGLAASLVTAGASGTAVPPGFTTTPTTTGGTAPTGNAAAAGGAGGSSSQAVGGSSKLTTSNTAKSTPTPNNGGGAAAGSNTASSSAPAVSGSSPARRGVSVGSGNNGESAAIALLSLISGIAAIALLH